MGDKKEQVPEYQLRFMVLRFLNARYPAQVEHKELEKVMETINCSPRKFARVLAYLKEKELLEGLTAEAFGHEHPEWVTVKITARGIDYLEELKENIRLQVEEKEREIGFQPYSQ